MDRKHAVLQRVDTYYSGRLCPPTNLRIVEKRRRSVAVGVARLPGAPGEGKNVPLGVKRRGRLLWAIR